MKKFICGLMSLLILFSLASCSVRTTIENSITNESKVAEETTRSDLTYDDDNDEKQPNENNDSDGNENTNKPDNNKATLGNVNNGVLKQAALETMDVPQNMTFIETSTAKEENNSAKINLHIHFSYYSTTGQDMSKLIQLFFSVDHIYDKITQKTVFTAFY